MKFQPVLLQELILSTLGAAIRHFKQNNVYFRVFIIFAISGSVGAFLGSLLTRYSPTVILLSIIVLFYHMNHIHLSEVPVR